MIFKVGDRVIENVNFRLTDLHSPRRCGTVARAYDKYIGIALDNKEFGNRLLTIRIEDKQFVKLEDCNDILKGML
jgi:hypothetical protein